MFTGKEKKLAGHTDFPLDVHIPAARASEEHVPEHTAQGAWSRSVGRAAWWLVFMVALLAA